MSEVVLDSAVVHDKLAKITATWSKVSHLSIVIWGRLCSWRVAIEGAAAISNLVFRLILVRSVLIQIFLPQIYQEKENAQASAPDGLIVVMGKVREDPVRIQSVDFL